MASADGSILIRTDVDTTGVKKGTKTIEGSMSSIGKSVAKLGVAMAAVFSVTKLIQFGKEAVNLASDLQEVQNVVDVAFGSMAYKIEEFSKTSIENFGISELSAKSMASTFMAMANGMGQSLDVASDKSIELTGRLADIMSFYNKSLDEVNTIGRAIYSGETEPLKAIGVIMTENQLKTFAMANGYKQLYTDMSAADKLLVRQEYFLQVTNQAAGDFVRTQGSWANQTRILSEQWKELLSIIGGKLIQILTPAVKLLNTILSSLINVANAMAKAFGINTAIQSTSAAISTDVGDISDSQSDITDSTNATNKALKKQLAFFDDINVLASETATGGSGKGIGGGTSGTGVIDSGKVADETNELSDFEKKMKRIRDIFKEGFDIGFKTDKFDDVFKNIKKIGEAMKKIWSNPELLTSMGKFSTSVVKMFGVMTGAVLSFTTSVTYGITGGIKDAVSDPSFQKFVSKKLSGVFDGLTQIAETTSDLAEAFAEIGKAFESKGFQDIISFFTKLYTYVNLTFLDTLVGLFADLYGYITAPITGNGAKWSELLENIFTIIGNLLEPLSQFLDLIMGNSKSYDETSFHAILKDITSLRSDTWGDALDGINSFLDFVVELTDASASADFTKPFVDLNNWLNAKKDLIRTWYNVNVAPWFTKERWSTTAQGMVSGIIGKWNGLVSWWNSSAIGVWFNNNVAPWLSFERWYSIAHGMYIGIASKWNEFVGWWNNSGIGAWFNNSVAPWFSAGAWQRLGENMRYGLYNGVKGVVANIAGVVNKIIDVVESMVNKVIDGMNTMIGKAIALANKVNLKIGINKLSHVNIGNIPVPALAKGAVIPPNKEFMAILGDQKSGTNIETPLQTMIDAFNTALNNRGGGSGSNQINLNIDGKTFARLTLDSYFAEMKRQGYDVAVIGG